MTKFEMLSVFWNTRVAFIEFLGSVLLIFFFLSSKHIVHQLKSNIFVSSFLYTLSFFSALFIAQATSGFLSNSDIKPFLIPQIVIFESIIKGLTNSFTGTLLYQGYFYIFASQILGVIFGYLAFFLYTKMVKNIAKYKEDFHKIIMVEKAPQNKLGQKKLTLRCWLFCSSLRRKLTPKVLAFLNFQMQQNGEY
ncbi:MAG4940 family membrane protein [Mesomycoplasma ovipneumoniae]|uniref:MAG4940 family membrane protein n=1 Tax=Mesomycoplasma ovipneumoniae TaxID=29562 RepID=UPI00311C971A